MWTHFRHTAVPWNEWQEFDELLHYISRKSTVPAHCCSGAHGGNGWSHPPWKPAATKHVHGQDNWATPMSAGYSSLVLFYYFKKFIYVSKSEWQREEEKQIFRPLPYFPTSSGQPGLGQAQVRSLQHHLIFPRCSQESNQVLGPLCAASQEHKQEAG